MDYAHLKQISRLISVQLKEEMVIISAEKIASGFQSNGYKLHTRDGRAFFLKYVHSHDLGFEFTERQIFSLMTSHGMLTQAGHGHPGSIGVIAIHGDVEILLPHVNDETSIYHVQEFAGNGTSYLSMLDHASAKKHVDRRDHRELGAIADTLVKIHRAKHSSTDLKRLAALYDDGIRNVLIHPELTLKMISEFPRDYAVLDLDEQKEFMALMFDTIKQWLGKYERLVPLHGDFWGANIFFRDDGNVWVIDFSRIPWGDPGIDVGWFLIELLWRYHATGNNYYKELCELWLDLYEEKAGDRDIRAAVTLALGFGIIHVNPRFFPDLDYKVGLRYVAHLKKILKRGEFVWED